MMPNSGFSMLRRLGLVLTLLVFASGAAHAEQPKVHFWLTVLHNNDGESQLIDAGSGLEDFGGVARFKTLVEQLKHEALHGPRSAALRQGGKRGVVMLSSGDNFLAGPEFNAGLENGIPFFDTTALDLIGYDAICLGNHDFDFGPDVLADFLAGFQFPVPYLSANLDFSAEPALQTLVDQDRIAGSVVIEERGERIGIVGATTENLSFISSPRNVAVGDVAAAVQAEIDALESQGVNKVILISHLQNVDEDQELALELEGVDVMIAGGGDEVLANPRDLLVPGDTLDGGYPLWATGGDGADIPVVTTAGEYKYLGRLVVGFDKAGRVVALDEPNSGPVRVAGGDNPDVVDPDPTMLSLVTEPVQDFVAALDQTVVGVSQVDLDGRRDSVRTVETNEGNLIADALLWQATQLADGFGVATPDVAIQNGGGIRNNTIIAAGDITELDTFDMLPFSNFVTVVPDIPRAQFKEILENAVSKVESTSGRFAQIAGFSMVWSGSGTAQVLDDSGNVTTAGGRVVDVTLDDGTPIVVGGVVQAGSDLSIATIDFLARGGDQYPYRGAPFTSVGVSYQQALANYIAESGGLGGVISVADYPQGGEGRITSVP